MTRIRTREDLVVIFSCKYAVWPYKAAINSTRFLIMLIFKDAEYGWIEA